MNPLATALAAALSFTAPDFPRAEPYPIHFGYRSPAPPESGSAEQRRDLDAVLEFQRRRTPDECRRAGVEVNLGFQTFFGPPYGPLPAESARRLTPFFDRVQATAQAQIFREKNHWKRPRPFRVDPAIDPCVNREPSYSYSSGHAAIARVFALVLKEMSPDRGADWDARALQIGEDRILGGVHYPTDVAEGRAVAPLIVEALLQDPSFLSDLRAASASFASDELR